jgi:hypothetical protein
MPQNTRHGTARSTTRNISTAGIPGSFILNQLQVYYVTNFMIIFFKKWAPKWMDWAFKGTYMSSM